MRAFGAWGTIYLAAAIAGALISFLILAAFIKKKSAASFFFLCFFLFSTIDIFCAFAFQVLRWSSAFPFTMQGFWRASLSISRLRYVFLVFFAHSFRKYRFTPLLSALLPLLIAGGAALPYFVYSPVPEIIETAVVLYFFLYILSILRSAKKASLTPERKSLAGIAVSCTAFFLIGIFIDLLEVIPQTSPYISVFYIDFSPVYALSMGALVCIRLLGDSFGSGVHGDAAPATAAEANGRFSALSTREREIVGHILSGETNPEIAEKLFISESTVKKHVNRIFKKLKVENRWSLLRISRETAEYTRSSI